jgi:hypothetical protein
MPILTAQQPKLPSPVGSTQPQLSYDAHRSEPFLVKPKVAWKMLACGNTRGYELLAAGELESFLDGRSRKITVASIRRYIERHLGKSAATESKRRRGRPRKLIAARRREKTELAA